MASKKLFEVDSVPQVDPVSEDFELDDGWDDSVEGEVYELEDYPTPIGLESIPSNSLGMILGMGHETPNRQEYLADALPFAESQFPPEERRQISEDIEQLGDWYKCNRDSGRSIYVKQEWLENIGDFKEGMTDEHLICNLRYDIRDYEDFKGHDYTVDPESSGQMSVKTFYLYNCLSQYDPDHGLEGSGMDTLQSNLHFFADKGLTHASDASQEAYDAVKSWDKATPEHTWDAEYENIQMYNSPVPAPDFRYSKDPRAAKPLGADLQQESGVSTYAADLVKNVDTFETKYAQQAAELGVSPVALGVVTECHYGDGTDLKRDVNSFLVTHKSMAETGKDEVISGHMMDNAWLAHYLYSQSDEGQAFAGASSNVKDTLTKLAENGLWETSKLTEDQASAAKEFASNLQVPDLSINEADLRITGMASSGMAGQQGAAGQDQRGVQAGIIGSGAAYAGARMSEQSGMAAQGVGGQAGIGGVAGQAGVSGQVGMTGQAGAYRDGVGGQAGMAGQAGVYRNGIGGEPLPGTGDKSVIEPSAAKRDERVKQAEDLFGGIGQSFKDARKTKGLDFEK